MSVSRLYCLNLNRKWKNSSRARHRFEVNNETWLQQEIKFPKCIQEKKHNIDVNCSGQSRGAGRPRKPFLEVSNKTKKRRVQELSTSWTSDELQFAAQTSNGFSKPNESSSLSPHQALALSLDLGLSERKYKLLRSMMNGVHQNCLPSLYAVNQARNILLPSIIIVTETSAEVDLQVLLNLTSKSIIELINLNENKELKLICKWGFDGSSGHSQYKKVFTDALCTDEYLLIVAMVPIRLLDKNNGKQLWINPRPSSTHYCRPIKFMFKKENATLVRDEENDMNNKINQLCGFKVQTKNGNICQVSFEMLFTMMDGSVSNVLSNTNATSKCIICGASPKDMNSEYVVDRPSKVENYRFGLSTLHCWIRFFECLLHIGYRLPVKTWQIRGNENKEIVENNKKRIQAEFKSKLGLLVDKPKPGYGSTNDGNTARVFFYNPDLSSEITGVDKGLIKEFSIILRVLASGSHIHMDKFMMLLQETRLHYLELYPWYYMPSSVHKVLVHGSDIIGSFSLPIGQLSEDV
ncbi:uncharacterized protein LOC115882218 [Sitophilus oryzae]|uniref:Uncharacterized protein LOC115882218 n=1 Tax=Sitophilus oryzae TaxID=7048 RepID=A0A6J2XZ85_SITOR|nr:uncharacterized protein LOC115882218 [Sitophilus oryzae]